MFIFYTEAMFTQEEGHDGNFSVESDTKSISRFMDLVYSLQAAEVTQSLQFESTQQMLDVRKSDL